MRTRVAVASALFLVLGCVGRVHAQAGGFVAGDLYLYDPVITGLSSASGGIMRINPVTGAASMLVHFDSTLGRPQAIAYDPYRNRIIFTSAPSTVLATWLIDANGQLQKLGFDGHAMCAFAPTGDGRIYFHDEGIATDWINWLDAANVRHTLLDSTGTAPLLLNGSATSTPNSMIFDAATNSLILAHANSASTQCTGGNATDITVRKIPLNATGTQASGPMVCTQFVVDAGGGNLPVGLSHGPGGSILLVVDTNQNALQPRMISINPATLAMSAFASNGPYTGSAATNAGTWSNARGQIVVLDTFSDVLRAFSAGGSGDGTVIVPSTTISTPGGTNELATLLEIPSDPCPGDFLAYGVGLGAPFAPVPVLTGGGCPTPGSGISLAINGVRGGATGMLFVGLTSASIPLVGGTFLVGSLAIATPIAVSGPTGTIGAGSLFLPATLPATVTLIGLDAYIQCAFNDPTAIHGATLTNGLRMEIR